MSASDKNYPVSSVAISTTLMCKTLRDEHVTTNAKSDVHPFFHGCFVSLFAKKQQ